MTYCFWDMDHTLINNDCDVSWKEFLISKGLADAEQMKWVDEYYRQYSEGILKVDDYLEFQLKEFTGRGVIEIRELCQEHFETVVKDRIYPAALERVQQQISEGWRTVLLTATNLEIALPVAEYFGIPRVIASELEMTDDSLMFTGRPTGVYCCGEGKLERLQMFCKPNYVDPADVHYYGDSISDAFVLRAVGHPHVVNPMPKLREEAEASGWDIVEFTN